MVFLTINYDGNIEIQQNGKSTEILSVEDYARFLAENPEVEAFSKSSSIDFPHEWTDNENTLRLVKTLFK